MALTPGTNRQVPEHAIYDANNKQTYLGNQYIYTIGSQTPGVTTEYPLLLLQNPAVSTSAFPSGYKSLFINLKNIISLTGSASALLRVYLNPTITSAGTAQTPLNLRPLSPNTSIATLTLNPTISANGSLVEVIASQALTTFQSQLLEIIDPTQALLITVQTSTTSTAIACELGWFEQ